MSPLGPHLAFRLVAALLPACLALPCAAHDALAAAHARAPEVARSVVLVEYVLQKEGRAFGGVGQRVELASLGVVVSADGLVVLSDNVFPEDEDRSRSPARPHSFVVRLRDGTRLDAKLVGRDEEVGFAFLRVISGPPLTPVELTAPRDLSPGTPLLLVTLLPEKYGNEPAYLPVHVTAEVLHPRHVADLDLFIQDSEVGAPAIDEEGRVVGIVAVDRLENGGGGPLQSPLKVISAVTRGKAAGYPVLVPGGELIDLVASPPPIVEPEQREKAWLGVTLQSVDPKLAEYWGLEKPFGMMVTSVWEGSPADRAGLRPEDLIVGFDGHEVHAPDDDAVLEFIELVQGTRPGKEVEVRLLRDLEPRTIRFELGTAPKTAARADEYRSKAFGLVAQDLTIDIVQSRGWPPDQAGALVREIETAGPAQVGGLQQGDLILAVGDRRVESVDDLAQALVAAEERQANEVVFFVLRDPDTLFVVVEPSW